jgi:hypothetical protein
MTFYQWLWKKHCRGCQIQEPCEKCFVKRDAKMWYTLVMQWEKETKNANTKRT